MIDSQLTDELTHFAHTLADASGQAILPYFRSMLAIDNKLGTTGFDPVTEADREGERVIRSLITSRYPEHGILGEEHGHKKGTSPLTWVIDPIDGTRSFMTGSPQWGTLIALNNAGAPVIGVLDQPFTRERWTGTPKGTFFRHAHGDAARVATRACKTLDTAVLSTTSPRGYFTEREQEAFWAVSQKTKLTRFGGDCYAYGLLAMGLIDIIIESSLKAWDIQALIPIIRGAGGVVTDWTGADVSEGGQVVACGDATLHRAVLEILAAF